jgi:hypothetical protein
LAAAFAFELAFAVVLAAELPALPAGVADGAHAVNRYPATHSSNIDPIFFIVFSYPSR